MAKASRKRKVRVKDMKFRNDPMIRLYDRTQEWLQEKGRPFLLGVLVVAGAILLYGLWSYVSSYRQGKAEQALSAALERFDAQVYDTPPANATGRYYTDQKTKWEEAAAAFERLASDYPGAYGAMGRYYAGTAFLHFDRDKGLEELQQVVSKNKQPTCDLARLAIAQNREISGEFDKAIEGFQSIENSSFVPREVVLLGLGHCYEKTGEKEKAVDAYFQVAAADRSSTVGGEAERRLTALAPDKLKDLPARNPTENL